MKTDENWSQVYIDKLKPHKHFIEFMEKEYGIGIDEWERAMQPLHYLDAFKTYIDKYF